MLALFLNLYSISLTEIEPLSLSELGKTPSRSDRVKVAVPEGSELHYAFSRRFACLKDLPQRLTTSAAAQNCQPAASLTLPVSGGSSMKFGTSSCMKDGISPALCPIPNPPSYSASSPKASSSASNSASSTSSGTS